ncbi:hypothetical protein, partial [Blautia wexlerae]|uniref:hypothetical protein n=1 Tax=Blautia wexlerae TaxID=418240 RepID=UPI0034A46B8D
ASNAVVNSLFDGASTHRTIYPLLDARSDPSRQQMLLDAGHTKLQGFLKKTICRESEDSRDMQKHSSK